MSKGKVNKISGEQFKEEIAKGLTLIDFFADWCGPCRMLAPVLDQLASEMDGTATIAKLDIDAHQEIAAQYQITSVPTMILFKDGTEAGRIVGLRDASQLKEFILSAK